MTFSFTMDRGWIEFDRAVDPAKLNKRMILRIGRATLSNALYMRKQVRRGISDEDYEGNAELTMSIKGEDKPLAGVNRGGGGLFGSISHEQIDAFTAFIGIKRGIKTKSGAEMADLAELLHEGFDIDVTDEMRGLFQAVAQAQAGEIKPGDLRGRAAFIYRKAKGRPIYPLEETTSFLFVPPRPFIERPFSNPAILAKIMDTWRRAAQEALKP